MDYEIKINPLYFRGIPYSETKTKCNCECHQPGRAIMHFMPCCEEGFLINRQPLINPSIPNPLRDQLKDLVIINLPFLIQEPHE